MSRLLIFDTHPIQYRSPVFTALFEKHPDLKVYFFNSHFNSRRWWFHERGKTPPQTWGIPLQNGFPNQVLQTEQGSAWTCWWTLNRVLREEKPEQVVLYGYYLPEHWMLRVLCRLRRIPVIFIGETFQKGNWSLRRLIKAPLRKFFFAGVSRFIAIGRKTEAYYRGLGIEEERIIPAKYCVDLSFFRQSPETALRTRNAWRQKYGIPENAFVVLFVGRLFERKRPQDVLEIQKALAHIPGTYSVVVGNGPLEKNLRSSSAHLPRMIWTGFQNQAGTRDAYYGSDVLFVPSEYETWGLVVNEAAACGLTSVLTDTCGVAGDLTVHGETGFVFPRGDVASALHWISRLKEDRSLCRSLGAAAREKVEKEYGISQFADAFVRALAPARLD
jgi:glycosyltransferase involved in cell wall biosynthesis